MDLDQWWAGGVRLPEGVFTRADGAEGDRVVTWLHGFPISSWDWAKLHAALPAGRRDITLDLLGFGASAKPAKRYSILEQADLVEAVWRHWGVTETAIVTHDYGVSIAQELLARREDGVLPVELSSVTFLNGGIIPELHRPTRIQKLLAGPLGPVLSRLMKESTFVDGYRAVLGELPGGEELSEHWRAMARDNGHHNVHRILGYIAERRTYRNRWVDAVQRTDLPTTFIWGPKDPVSGAHVLPALRELKPDAAIHVLEGLGHAPHMEAPERVVPLLTHLNA